MKPHVLILDGAIYTAVYRPTGDWRRLLGDVAFDSIHLPSEATLPAIDRYTHILITGSEASIVRPAPWFEVEALAIRQAVDLGKPILASCFGHQMLVRTLAGTEWVGTSPTPELGWIEVEIVAQDELLDDLPNPFHTFAAHFDEVRPNLPPPWRILATNERCRVQAVRYGDRPIWGIQPHPEIRPEEARRLLKMVRVGVPAKARLASKALAQTPKDDGVAAEIVRRFLTLNPA
jgi:GMP synthase-like glutamine amidotransferase